MLGANKQKIVIVLPSFSIDTKPDYCTLSRRISKVYRGKISIIILSMSNKRRGIFGLIRNRDLNCWHLPCDGHFGRYNLSQVLVGQQTELE